MKMPQKLHFSRRLLKKLQLTADIIQMDFERGEIDFEAGNFITINVPSGDGAMLARSYSILSSPHQKDIFSLCVKVIPGGVGSNFLANLQVGDYLEFDGPFGIFKLPKDSEEKLVFIATGVGIVPFVSIISYLWQENYSGELIVYFGTRHEEDLIYVNLFREIAKSMANFKFHVTLSQPKPGWDGLKGRVTAHLNDLDTDNGDFYVCGNGDAVKSVSDLLQEKGVSRERLHVELFTSIATLPTNL